eukprot:Rhum_TRINITY_DN9262_c0_g1::Rhum_TRINITY_DN9262_c0_g1_i1::g.32439::m.32439
MRGKGGGKGYGLPNKKGGGGKGIWSSGTAGPECLRNPAKDVDPAAAGRPGGAPQPPAPEHSNPNGGVGDRQQQQPPTTAAPIHSGSWGRGPPYSSPPTATPPSTSAPPRPAAHDAPASTSHDAPASPPRPLDTSLDGATDWAEEEGEMDFSKALPFDLPSKPIPAHPQRDANNAWSASGGGGGGGGGGPPQRGQQHQHHHHPHRQQQQQQSRPPTASSAPQPPLSPEEEAVRRRKMKSLWERQKEEDKEADEMKMERLREKLRKLDSGAHESERIRILKHELSEEIRRQDRYETRRAEQEALRKDWLKIQTAQRKHALEEINKRRQKPDDQAAASEARRPVQRVTASAPTKPEEERKNAPTKRGDSWADDIPEPPRPSGGGGGGGGGGGKGFKGEFKGK